MPEGDTAQGGLSPCSQRAIEPRAADVKDVRPEAMPSRAITAPMSVGCGRESDGAAGRWLPLLLFLT
jgi:hypothetical protein